MCIRDRKDYRAALADYDKAIGLNPDCAEAYFNRGLTHIFLGNNRQGISDLSKAGELGDVYKRQVHAYRTSVVR